MIGRPDEPCATKDDWCVLREAYVTYPLIAGGRWSSPLTIPQRPRPAQVGRFCRARSNAAKQASATFLGQSSGALVLRSVSMVTVNLGPRSTRRVMFARPSLHNERILQPAAEARSEVSQELTHARLTGAGSNLVVVVASSTSGARSRARSFLGSKSSSYLLDGIRLHPLRCSSSTAHRSSHRTSESAVKRRR